MHKKIALFSAIAVATIPFAPAFAIMDPATAVPTAENRPEMRAQRIEDKGNKIENRGNAIAEKQTIRDEKQQARTEKRLEFQDKKEKMDQARCKNLESRITNRVNRYENNRRMLENVYGNMQSRIARLVERLKSAGADTTQLEKDLATLNDKIAKLKTDHETFMSTLVESRSFVCGNSEGEFKGKIDEARKVPEIIKQDRQDIKNFFQTTIKADLQAIRATLADQKDEEQKKNDPKPTPAVEPSPAPTPQPLP